MDEPSQTPDAAALTEPPVGDEETTEADLIPGELRPTHDFSHFYRAEKPRLITFLMTNGADSHCAGDIAHESLVKTWRRWDSISFPKTYVRVVATRRWLRVVSKPEYKELSLDELIREDPDQAQVDPPGVIIYNDESQSILRRLRRLPPRQWQVMAWTYDGYQPKEIAEILRISPDAVRASLMKARKTLILMREEEGCSSEQI